MPLRAVTGPVFDSFFNVSFRMLSETYRAVLVDVSYLAVDALEGSLVERLALAAPLVHRTRPLKDAAHAQPIEFQ